MPVRLRHALVVVFLLAAGLLPSSAYATNIGIFALDAFIPGDVDGAPGTYSFSILNLTNSLEEDFPVNSNEVIVGAQVTLNRASAPPIVRDLGDIGPGLFEDGGLLQFVTSDTFVSAILTGTLSSTTLGLTTGATVTVDSQIVATLVPRIDPDTFQALDYLSAGDVVVIEAIDTAVAVAEPPEPTWLLLITGGLIGMLARRRRERRQADADLALASSTDHM